MGIHPEVFPRSLEPVSYSSRGPSTWYWYMLAGNTGTIAAAGNTLAYFQNQWLFPSVPGDFHKHHIGQPAMLNQPVL